MYCTADPREMKAVLRRFHTSVNTPIFNALGPPSDPRTHSTSHLSSWNLLLTKKRYNVRCESLGVLIQEAMPAVGIDDQLAVRNLMLEVKAVHSREHEVVLPLS